MAQAFIPTRMPSATGKKKKKKHEKSVKRLAPSCKLSASQKKGKAAIAKRRTLDQSSVPPGKNSCSLLAQGYLIFKIKNV